MLYLMMDKSNNTVKVGYSDRGNVKHRRRAYKTHNPLAIMRSTCAGNTTLERKCQKQLEEMGQRIKGTEWFIVDDWTFTHLSVRGMGAFNDVKTVIHFNENFA